MKNYDLEKLVDGQWAEGHELLDLMKLAADDPDVVLTEQERLQIFLGRFLFAAVVEGANQAAVKFSVEPAEQAATMWMMAGEALATHAFQAFTPRNPREWKLLRNSVKASVMEGYDHVLALLQREASAP